MQSSDVCLCMSDHICAHGIEKSAAGVSQASEYQVFLSIPILASTPILATASTPILATASTPILASTCI